MSRVRRFDDVALRLDKAIRLDNGWMRVPAAISSVGVFAYETADGKVTLEYRPPEEVFHVDSVDSFRSVPVTLDHPPVALDGSNTQMFAVGNAGDALQPSGKVLEGHVLLTANNAVQAADGGKRQLSPGYTVELDMTPGVTPDGQRYDAVQRKIRGNHVAIVDRGRQGSTVALRMDGDAVAVSDTKRTDMATITIDGKRHQVSDDVAAAFKALQKDAKKFAKMSGGRKDGGDEDGDEEPDESETPPASPPPAPAPAPKPDEPKPDSAMQARVDALAEENAKLRKDAEARIDARVELGANARAVLGDDFKLAGKTDTEVQMAVALAVDPDAKAKLEARKDDASYVAARYEIAMERWAERKDSGARLLDVARSAGGKTLEGDPVAEAKAKAQKTRSDAWKRETSAA